MAGPMAAVSSVPCVALPGHVEALRADVRAFLADEIAAGMWEPRCDNWMTGHDPAFSGRLAERGWLGMTWPAAYGGHDRGALERFVVTEELVAAGAPVAAHWAGDRQIGPGLLRFGTEEQKCRFLPAMVAGRGFWALCMSEPDSGSDLASVRTTARRVGDDWRVTGQKIWTSGAHLADFAMVLCRTSPAGDGRDRHEGLSQLIVDLHTPGVDIRPIQLMSGEYHFDEVFFDDVAVPLENMLGAPGEGWSQVTTELAYERSGPERFLSTFPLFQEVVAAVGTGADRHTSIGVGELFADLWTLRRLSLGIAALLDAGAAPELEAAQVKDLGTKFEREVIERSRRLVSPDSTDRLSARYAEGLLHAPGFTIRGGTTEVLRGVVARRLGLR